MLRRVGKHSETTNMGSICSLRLKFNDALKDAVAKVGQHILTINSCNSYDHFDKMGRLSTKGQADFWYELDELLEHFDMDKIKLLRNPKYLP